jgi:hypothetical protein
MPDHWAFAVLFVSSVTFTIVSVTRRIACALPPWRDATQHTQGIRQAHPMTLKERNSRRSAR